MSLLGWPKLPCLPLSTLPADHSQPLGFAESTGAIHEILNSLNVDTPYFLLVHRLHAETPNNKQLTLFMKSDIDNSPIEDW